MSETSQTATITREPLTLKNGSKKDPKSGKFLPGVIPTTAIQPGDSARGRELARLKKEKLERAIQEKIAGKGVVTRGDTAEDAMADAWGDTYDGARAIAHKRPREAAQTLVMLSQAQGVWPTDGHEGNRAVVAVQVNVSSAAPAQVYRIAAAAGEVVEGELAGDA